jgi:NADPH-dependent 2,4-dienoyl-CoA reductase/sulfur reductase-like enzyme
LHTFLSLDFRKEYLEIPCTNMISKVEPSVAEKSLINHNDYLGGTQVITASSADVRGEAVITAEGRLVEYTYLVIATGHTNQCPRNRRDRLEQFQEGKPPCSPIVAFFHKFMFYIHFSLI